MFRAHWPLYALVYLGGCGLPSFDGPAMGTTYTVQADCPAVPRDGVRAAIRQVDELMTTYAPNSDLMRLNRALPGVWIEVDRRLVEVLMLAHEISTFTGGAFDVTAGLVSARLGFGAPLSGLDDYERGSFRDIETRFVDNRPFARRQRQVMIDLSAIAKGFAIDRAIAVLEHAGCAAALVELGGEVRAFGAIGRSPWRIGIEADDGSASMTTVVEAVSVALATSGDYRQRRAAEDPEREVSHIVDVHNRADVGAISQVTVAARTAVVADALATGLFAMRADGPAFARRHGIPARFVTRERSTPGEQVRDVFETASFRAIGTTGCRGAGAATLWCRF